MGKHIFLPVTLMALLAAGCSSAKECDEKPVKSEIGFYALAPREIVDSIAMQISKSNPELIKLKIFGINYNDLATFPVLFTQKVRDALEMNPIEDDTYRYSWSLMTSNTPIPGFDQPVNVNAINNGIPTATTSSVYILKSEPLMTDIKDATVSISEDEYYHYRYVSINLSKEDAVRFADLTEAYAGQAIALVVNDSVLMAPRVMQRIEGGKIGVTGDYDTEIVLEKLTQ